MTPKVIAHRGYSTAYDGNTWKAIKSAFESGADACEVDLMLTKDKKIFVYHDYFIDNKLIAEMDSAEVKDKCPNYPFLEEIMEYAIDMKKEFFLEVKDRRMINQIIDILNTVPSGLFTIISFDAVFLSEFKKRNSSIKTCLILGSVLDAYSSLTIAENLGVNFLIPAWEERHPYPHMLINNEWINILRQKDIYTISWHEERVPELKELVKMGFFGLSTNNPPLLRKILNNNLL